MMNMSDKNSFEETHPVQTMSIVLKKTTLTIKIPYTFWNHPNGLQSFITLLTQGNKSIE